MENYELITTYDYARKMKENEMYVLVSAQDYFTNSQNLKETA